MMDCNASAYFHVTLQVLKPIGSSVEDVMPCIDSRGPSVAVEYIWLETLVKEKTLTSLLAVSATFIAPVTDN